MKCPKCGAAFPVRVLRTVCHDCNTVIMNPDFAAIKEAAAEHLAGITAPDLNVVDKAGIKH